MAIKKIVKKALKHFSFIWNCYCWMREHIMMVATLISPTLNVRLRYLYRYGKSINLSTPQTFIEKLNWLKLEVINKNEIYTNVRINIKYVLIFKMLVVQKFLMT